MLLLSILISLVSCEKVQVAAPVQISSNEILMVNRDTLKFQVGGENWKAMVQTPVQVLYPKVILKENQLSLFVSAQEGIIAGPGFITLQHEDQVFNFPVVLRNTESTSQLEDLRSPKTVNNDSSMVQQQILYSFDQSGNLTEVSDGNYFEENYLELSPNVGIFKGVNGRAVSSFYVDPGTVKEIPLSSSFNESNQTVTIKAGPLLDRYENFVSDGTSVIIYFEKDGVKSRIESVVQDAYCQLNFPLSKVENSTVKVSIAHVFSNTINLTYHD